MKISEFTDYREIINTWVQKQPRKGRGQFKVLAEFLNVSPVFLSQVVNGSKDINEDHAYLLADFMEFTQLETEYFVLLVHRERAQNHQYKKFVDEQISKKQAEFKNMKSIINPNAAELSPEDTSIYCSHPKYALIRLGATLNGVHNPEDIAKKLKLSRTVVIDVLKFLVSRNLLIETANGYALGASRLLIPKDSHFFKTRNMHYRFEAIRAIDQMDDISMCFSALVAISSNDAAWIKAKLLDLVKEATEKIGKSESEELYCLNIDWYKFPIE